jgi:inositol phosphorylceramide mannosyltransferase catalytic subunit
MPNVTTGVRNMSRRPSPILLIICLPIIYVLYTASSLIALIFEGGLTDAVTLLGIEKHANATGTSHPIPKIIHQTWKNEDIPEQWQIAQYTWYGSIVPKSKILIAISLDLHPDYHYMVSPLSVMV